MSKLDNFSDQQFIEIVINSNSVSEVRRKIGYGQAGRYTSKLIENRCRKLNIQLPKYRPHPPNWKQKTTTEVFVENSTYSSTSNLKKKILKHNLIEYKCDKCGNCGEWLGQKLSLQLHHKNGINNDNRTQNLCFLCPNCHSQTQTYAGRGQRRAKHEKS